MKEDKVIMIKIFTMLIIFTIVGLLSLQSDYYKNINAYHEGRINEKQYCMNYEGAIAKNLPVECIKYYLKYHD